MALFCLRDWWNPISNLTFCLMLFAGRMAKSYFKQEHDLGKKIIIFIFYDLVILIVFVEGWLIWKEMVCFVYREEKSWGC